MWHKISQVEAFKRLAKHLTWHDYVFVGTVLFFLIIFAQYISSYQQIPSPIFGGDYYRDRGFVYDIANGNAPWDDGYYIDELQYYPYLIFALQAGIVKITGLHVDQVFLLFPLVTLILASIVWYLLGTLMFKSKLWGLTTVLAFIALFFSLNPKSASVAVYLLTPAFFLFWFRYEKHNTRFNAIIAGIILGILALTYGATFLSVFFSFVFSIGILFLYNVYKTRNVIEKVKNYFFRYYIILCIAVLIALIFFLPLIIKYHWHTVNEVSKWGDTSIDLLGPSWIIKALQGMFFPLSQPLSLIARIVAFAGLISLFFMKNIPERKLILLFFAGNIAAMQHHLITRPLLNTWFLPEKLSLLSIFIPIFFTAGLVLAAHFFKARAKYIVAGVAALLLVSIFFVQFSSFKQSQWEQMGRQEPVLNEQYYALGEWIDQNVQPTQTILSNDESGFMLATVSARKVVLTRRTHASYFVDIDQRIADVAVAFYGGDLNKTQQILAKYNAQYFYIDDFFFTHPMRTSTAYEKYLKEHNVSYIKTIDRYDIAMPLEYANKKELLIIHPQNLTPGFMDLWEPVYGIELNNQVVSVLARLKTPQ